MGYREGFAMQVTGLVGRLVHSPSLREQLVGNSGTPNADSVLREIINCE